MDKAGWAETCWRNFQGYHTDKKDKNETGQAIFGELAHSGRRRPK